MWIATRQGFFSIVCGYRYQDGIPYPDTRVLMIRARRKDHLEALRLRFPSLGDIVTETGTDYPHRIITDRRMVGEVVASAASSIDYHNFKREAERVHGSESAYVEFLHDAWASGLRMEDVGKPNRIAFGTGPVKKAAKRKGKR